MFKKFLVVCLMSLLVVGCGSSNELKDNSENTSESKYKSLTIKTHLTNEEVRDDSYLVFLLVPGMKKTEPGEATQTGYYGPFETDANGEVKFDLSYNLDIPYYLEEESSKSNNLQVIVTTKEDIYMRNPLNAETYVQFVKNSDEDTKVEFPYYVTKESLDVSITDKYPDNVLSLTFPDATFVIKLEFANGFVPTTSYEVSIHKPSATGDGIGSVRTGRISRSFQYWDTPFFATDNLKAWDGTIVIRNFETNAIVEYEGYPKNITFNENGKCEQGDIIKVKINK